MTNLVNELQISAEQDDVLTVLRKTMRFASKLNRKDISDWLQLEQSGYPDNQDVPDYRKIRISIAFITNGFVPAGFGQIMNGVQNLPSSGDFGIMPIGSPISTVQTWIASLDKEGGGLYEPADEEQDQFLRSMYRFDPVFAKQITLLLCLNSAQVRAIPERIKDKVLVWACTLEQAGVTGEGMSFSTQEKEIAHSITFNISDSHIEQLNNMGNNRKGNR
ncbi:MAG TPA: hypothetical protein VG122_20385 [Gemmata sp.]|nr:hypothetical protein [Gemmata sp.]